MRTAKSDTRAGNADQTMSASTRISYLEKINLSTSEAAHYLSIGEHTLSLSRIKGSLFGRTPPAFIKFGRAVRYPRKNLDEWLERCAQYTTLAESANNE